MTGLIHCVSDDETKIYTMLMSDFRKICAIPDDESVVEMHIGGLHKLGSVEPVDIVFKTTKRIGV